MPAQADTANELFALGDQNKDGALSAKEFGHLYLLAGAFKEADKDGDGKLSKDEFAAYYHAMPQERPHCTLPP